MLIICAPREARFVILPTMSEFTRVTKSVRLRSMSSVVPESLHA